MEVRCPKLAPRKSIKPEASLISSPSIPLSLFPFSCPAASRKACGHQERHIFKDTMGMLLGGYLTDMSTNCSPEAKSPEIWPRAS